MKISPIFNAKEHLQFHKYTNDVELKNPFTFIINFGGFKMLPTPVGFRTEDEAFKTALKFQQIFNPTRFVAVVLKNADFTAGNGPMLLDSVFKRPEEAHDYVMAQVGIYGSSQHQQISYGVNIHGGLYGIVSYNGYDIKLKELK